MKYIGYEDRFAASAVVFGVYVCCVYVCVFLCVGACCVMYAVLYDADSFSTTCHMLY